MDILFEFLFELILEGSIEASRCSKIPKPIRYLLIFLICLFYMTVIGLFIFIGIETFNENKIGGTIIILFGIVFFILCLFSFRKIYIKKTSKENNNE